MSKIEEPIKLNSVKPKGKFKNKKTLFLLFLIVIVLTVMSAASFGPTALSFSLFYLLFGIPLLIIFSDTVIKLIPENIKIVENVNVYEKIKKSDLIITICSSLACDALIEKKPVLILGKFELSNKNICYELKNKNSFNKIIKLLINNKLKNNTKLWENFANYILKYYLYNISNHKFGEMNYRNFAAKVFNLAKKKKKIHLANRKNFNSINLWINKYIPERSFKSELKILLKKFFKKSS